ncbi:DUF5067 domain-containing protein [Bifidobacterium sp. LC6]|uniref:DUF5067 domain-containing protein n=1 Tax=Bifidobacterium colobi TaxID=2809026 RepID=A0ABS5UXE8_9BIFI|nr:DUF5067 domain-containing protein [Bifidobacterium colobi]MBT1175767.1 DUF5067 domain-containing protein [Bifidobacterium colobi]
MGLLNHDDDYVSPFDDGLPSYVDPARRAEYLSEIVETKHQMHEAAERRAKDWAAQSRTTTAARAPQSSGRSQQPVPQRSSRPSQYKQSSNKRGNKQSYQASTNGYSTSGHGADRRPNPVIAQQNASKPRKKRNAFFWVIVVCAVVWGLADPLLNTANNWLGSIVHSSSSSTSQSTSTDSTQSSDNTDSHAGSKDYSGIGNDDAAQATVEQSGDLYDSSGKAKAHLTIESAQSGPEDYTGSPTVIVSFAWKNTSGTTKNFDNLTFPEVYQHGLQLREVTLSSDAAANGYHKESAQTDVAAGKQFTTTLAYSLRETGAPIYVQSGPDALYSNKPLVVSAFTPSGNGKWTQVETSSLDKLPQATAEDRKGMTKIGKSNWDKVSLRFVDAKRGPDEDTGEGARTATAIVSVDWINESSKSEALNSFGTVEIKQQGVTLDNAYYFDNAPEGYVEQGTILNIRPGMKSTVQFAVELRSETAPLSVTFIPYASGAKTYTTTLKIQQ